MECCNQHDDDVVDDDVDDADRRGMRGSQFNIQPKVSTIIMSVPSMSSLSACL